MVRLPTTNGEDDSENAMDYPRSLWKESSLLCSLLLALFSEQSWPYKKWAMFDKNDPGRRFVHSAEWQHCTMYTFFGVAGAVQILARTCVCGLKEFEKFFLALAYFVEGLLFYFHVHGRTPLDISVHYMLVIAVMLAAAVTVAEIWKGDDPLLPFIRTGLTITQGTWFWQVGFMLYPPNGVQWDEDSHSNIMFVTMAFCWHIVACILVMAGVYGIVSLCLRSKGVYLVPYKQVEDEYQVGLMSLDDKGSSDNE
uniref:Transmembrane protein 45B-like n=1 Tax=Saccoglossus kowalevskii TaxID=10224 RepID=A0ABM0MLY7_SACKO|nr:PREDICTED: transmembrane protein 45B-like [Saccoglossus kowalevskii]